MSTELVSLGEGVDTDTGTLVVLDFFVNGWKYQFNLEKRTHSKNAHRNFNAYSCATLEVHGATCTARSHHEGQHLPFVFVACVASELACCALFVGCFCCTEWVDHATLPPPSLGRQCVVCLNSPYA